MTSSDIALAAINKIYGRSFSTADQLMQDLPILQENYGIIRNNIDALLTSALADATDPLYNEIARIKGLVATLSTLVAGEHP